ncbi:MAG: LysM peptidoglycan-binding domain-containing protein [Anaerolineales bacterium]|jgi:LysM repeat protein
MKRNRFLLFGAAILLLALLLGACQMPASTPPPGTGATSTLADGDFPRPEDVTNPFEGLEIAATQTAMAAQGTPGSEPGGGEGAAPTETPVVEQPAPTEPEATEAPAPTNPPKQESDVPKPTPGVPQSYTLNAGEFPYCIARRYNVNPSELLSLNGLSQYSNVLVGTTLRMPQTGNPFPGQRALISHPDTYRVGAGDTIYKIACAYGDVDPVYMAKYNGLKSPYTLEAGQTLNIP